MVLIRRQLPGESRGGGGVSGGGGRGRSGGVHVGVEDVDVGEIEQVVNVNQALRRGSTEVALTPFHFRRHR